MPVTAIKVDDVRVKFITVHLPPAPSTEGGEPKSFLQVELYSCDEEFIPQGSPSKSIHEKDEETYHKELRALAKEKGHFVPEESTDPEWNPDYKPEQDETAI